MESTPRISAVIVSYQSDIIALKKAINSLKLSGLPIDIAMVDNDSGGSYRSRLAQSGLGVRIIDSGLNKGFGAGHNLGFALREGDSDYHFVVNPDIIIPQGALKAIVEFMEAHEEVGLCVPKITDAKGQLQYLCKRKPSVMALFGRRFLPKGLAQLLLKSTMARYEMRDKDYNTTFEADFLSGCFMCFRSDIFKKIDGFDEHFFLYFEDADITMRAKEVSKAVHFPGATIVHDWNGGARANGKLTRIMLISAYKFYRKWGITWW